LSRTVLDLSRFVPAALTQIGNKWSRSSSQIYLKRFGVGINEWRVMSLLAVEPGITANRVCSVIGMDKAAVGRSVGLLEDGGYVSLKSHHRDGRSRLITLTTKGQNLHDKIIKIALHREKQLLASLTAKEVETLISLLNRLRVNIVRMQAEALDESNSR
jgi:DNA-binding MarR family transcriptional regulator